MRPTSSSTARCWDIAWRDEEISATMLRGVVGHRQVTDAYFVAQAAHRAGRVATLDRGLKGGWPSTVELLMPAGEE